jgi:hypothetical protein
MEIKALENQVLALEKLAGDQKVQQELGNRLLQEVARAVYEEKTGSEISNPDLELVLRKGDAVPAQLRDQVATDAEGRAVRDAVVQYLNLRIWIRIWIRFWLRIIIDTTFQTLPLNRFQDFADQVRFSDEEAALVSRLKRLAP